MLQLETHTVGRLMETAGRRVVGDGWANVAHHLFVFVAGSGLHQRAA